MPRLNHQMILYIMGMLLLCNAGFMILAAGVGGYYEDGSTVPLVTASFITLIAGGILMGLNRGRYGQLKKRDGYVIVTFGWIVMTLSGTLPYVLSGTIPDFTNAFFETMSGYSTTGASILNNIEVLPQGILFWRSLTHWIGGMGIIVLAIAILPLLGIGGMQLFVAEAPGVNTDKLKPRITDTAKRLWYIYVGLTIAQALLLQFAGMGLFDAVNHALSTMASGGFSTKNQSVSYWNDNPMIQYIIIFFMFLAGTNFVLLYHVFKGNLKKVWGNLEFRWYSWFTIFFALLVGWVVYFRADLSLSSLNHPMVYGELESAFRHGLFQVVAVITTTGFTTADYELWPPFLMVLIFGLFFLGGSSGSTAGGVKVMRHVILIRNSVMEFKRALHPNAVLPVRYNGKAIGNEIVFTVLGFFILYMLSFIIGAVVLGMMGVDMATAIGGSAASLGNVGPAFGNLGPIDSFDVLPSGAKWWMSFLMLIGRLELFTVLILFTPFFWRTR